MTTITLNLEPLELAAIVFAQTWHKHYNTEDSAVAAQAVDEAEASLMANLDHVIRHCECYFPIDIEPEAANYPNLVHPTDAVHVVCHGIDQTTTIVLPLAIIATRS